MEGNWKSILADVLRQHNHLHGRRNKFVSHLTIQQRGDRLYSCFEVLQRLGYHIEDPRHIGERATCRPWSITGCR